MASLEEYYDNGVLKSLLAKNINNSPVPIYPKSSSDIISYEDTTVKEKIKSTDIVISNLQNLVSNIARDVSSLNISRYDKAYIDSVVQTLNNKIGELQASITNIESVTNNFSFYDKDEIDTFLANSSARIENIFSNLSSQIDTLNSFLSTYYYNSDVVDSRLSNIFNQITTAKSEMQLMFENQLMQYKNAIEQSLVRTTNTYYTKDDVDSKISSMLSNITELSNDLTTIRNEANTMNNQAVIDITNYVNNKNDAVMAHVDQKISENLADVQRLIQAQTDAINVLVEALQGQIVNISSNVAEQIANIESGSTITYENGDEEEF